MTSTTRNTIQASSLDSFIQLASNAEFQYGALDCCQFAGRAFELVNGEDPAERFDYESESDADDLIGAYGSLFKLVCKVMGEPLPVDGGKDGDILLGKLFNGREILGTHYRGRMIIKTDTSVTDWPLERALYRWNKCQAR